MIGLIAGSGLSPIIFAKNVINHEPLLIIGFNNFTSPEIISYSTRKYFINIEEMGKIFEILKEEKVKKVVMLGKIPHNVVFSTSFRGRAAQILSKAKDKLPMTIFKEILKEFKKSGISVISPLKYLKNSTLPKGIFGSRENLSSEEEENIKFGYRIAKKLATLDIGQTIVIRDKSVISVEAMEGTDECILRAGKIIYGGHIVVKVARKSQDFRFDIPTVGTKTIDCMASIGAKILVVEANKVILLEKESVLYKAKENNICVVSV
jgi:DUF1009 family protein